MRCPENCNGHGRCLPSSFVDGEQPATGDPIALSSKDWDRYKHHVCHCDRGWEGLACTEKICPYGDLVMTVHPDHEVELSGCDVQEVAFTNFSIGDYFFLTFRNFERDRKTTDPIEFSGNATALARAVKMALEKMPNEVIPEVTTFGVEEGNSTNDVSIHVVFSDPRNTGLQMLLECATIAHDGFCSAGMRPMALPSNGVCHARHLLDEAVLNENIECGGRGHCDRQTGVCACNIGTYGEACEMITDFV